MGTNLQMQRWSLRNYAREARQGYSLIYRNLSETFHTHFNENRERIRERFKVFRRKEELVEDGAKEAEKNLDSSAHQSKSPSSASSSSSLIQTMGSPSLQQMQDDDHHPATLHYSFSLLAKMLNTTLLYIPAFGLSLRLGLTPSKLFITTSYLSLIAFTSLGMVVSGFIVEPSIEMFTHKMNKSLKSICVTSTLIGQFGYVIFGMFSCGYILYQRKFLQNFIYHRCSVITLTKSYQRRQICYLFIAFNAFAFLSEPLFSLLTLVQDVNQPWYWSNLDSTTFMVAKLFAVIGCGVGAAIIGSSGTIIPLMTCHLIVSSTKHLKNLVQKQSARYIQSAIWRQSRHNKALESLLNARTRKITVDFACDTLTMDWPDLLEPKEQAEWEFQEGADQVVESPSSTDGPQTRLQSRSLRSTDSTVSLPHPDSGSAGSDHFLHQNMLLQSGLASSKASCLLFLYKNLIKSLSELKCIILDYERKFGNFHQISSLLSCLIVSLWVTSALTEARQTSTTEGDASGTATTRPATLTDNLDGKQKTAYTLRILGSTTAFILSNIFIFLKCDCLSDRITKIKSQLFKMNIDLACTLINTQQQQSTSQPAAPATMAMATVTPRIKIHGDSQEVASQTTYSPPPSEPSSVQSANQSKSYWPTSIYEVDQFKGQLYVQQEQYVNQCPELDQIWSLYDQVERISSKVNFKFTSETYYSKRCMLLVFGRGVSLILFFIQIIDMYSS